MARYRGAVCRLCRREGRKLYLKGDRCESPKCAISKRNFPPGQHGLSRTKLSTYGRQLREKQKAKRQYGILERQFRRYFQMASRQRGVTGTVLLQLLERRLDNIVWRLGFAASRSQARQLVRHGFVTLNGKKAGIPSCGVKVSQTIGLTEHGRQLKVVQECLGKMDARRILPWLELNKDGATGRLLAIPSREDIPVELDEQMIVELYSK